jgi:hypothetical protein
MTHNYRITITRETPNEKYADERAEYENRNRYNNFIGNPPDRIITTKALETVLTEEEFNEVRMAVLRVMAPARDAYLAPGGIGEDQISDDSGNIWSATCPECNQKTMQVVRPGKVQCGNCG